MIQEQEQPNNHAYISMPKNNIGESLINTHLDASDILIQLKKMLMGYDYDEETEEWKASTIKIPMKIINAEGQEEIVIEEVLEGPLMDAKQIRITIGYLQMFLNSNTFLSYLDDKDRINDIMFDINLKLGGLFYALRKKINAQTKDFLWGMIEYPILLGLQRASSKVTLDAMSKMQQTIEHKELTNNQENKEFKLFG